MTITVVQSEHSFAIRLMEHLVVPTFVLDGSGKVIIWNKACERLTGVPADEVIGTMDHWRAFYEHPRLCLADIVCREQPIANMAGLYADHSALRCGARGMQAENWCAMPRTGTKLYLGIDAGPIFDEAGNLIAVVETLRDLTEQKRAQQALESLAAMDSLTGIPNRRCFDQSLEANWMQARREKTFIGLLLIDVDHFKAYNDGYGHQPGDDCLRQIAAAIGSQALRPLDLAARYGGEEFAILLPETGPDGAWRVAERVRETVAQLAIPHAYSTTAAHVTLSIGIACLIPDDGAPAESLITAADQALYAAKNHGRDQIRMYGD